MAWSGEDGAYIGEEKRKAGAVLDEASIVALLDKLQDNLMMTSEDGMHLRLITDLRSRCRSHGDI